MKIFLIRHGKSRSDIEDRYGGDFDDHLTAKGKKQSEMLAMRLEGKGIEKIFSSPRFRAKETAEILGKKLGIEMEIVNNLRERNFYGVLTGMKKEEAKKKYPMLVEKLSSYKNTIKGAEPYNDFKGRIIKAFITLTKARHKTIAIATHGGPISCIFREVLKKSEFRRVEDCAVFEIESEKGTFKLLEMEGAEFQK